MSDEVAPIDLKDLACLVVDSTGRNLREEWSADANALDTAVVTNFATIDEAVPMIETGSVASIVVFADATTEDVLDVLKAYRSNVGAIGAFQAIVCDDPDPGLMADVFEFGIEQFLRTDNWIAEVLAFNRTIREAMNDSHSSEYRALQLMALMRTGQQKKLEALKKELEEEASYDFLAAYSFGRALEATGKFDDAVTAYKSSTSMNKLFRPSKSSLGENLLVTGKLDEALDVFQELEKSNSADADRKLRLATIYIEKGDVQTAKKYMAEASKLTPNNPKLEEAKAHLFLRAGNVGEAFKLMDKLQEVGPFFAAKLNEMGIKLSQAGKGKSALALYQKAHRVVRPELRYKISINAALACHRLGNAELALKYLKRCEMEYGERFAKLDKIKAAVLKTMKKNQAA